MGGEAEGEKKVQTYVKGENKDKFIHVELTRLLLDILQVVLSCLLSPTGWTVLFEGRVPGVVNMAVCLY